VSESLFGPPERIRIPGDGPIEYVGQLDDGRQYMTFVTGAVPDGYLFPRDNDDWRKVKSWLAVLHMFDAAGNHLQSEVRLGGYDIEGAVEAGDKAEALLHDMFAPFRSKRPKRCDIYVKPFTFVFDGVTHGLIYEAFQPEEDAPVIEAVMLQPRGVMFHPPWDSGEWST
jgi:hypothetical protein